MRSHFIGKYVAILGTTLALAACSTTSTSTHGDADHAGSSYGGPEVSDRTSHSQTMGVGGQIQFSGQDQILDEAELLNKTVYYFAFDNSDINDDYQQYLQAHAAYLAANPNALIRVEGHTDERGTREYNIALGERRAQSVANFLMLEGVSPEQLAIVSYGQEKPAVAGHDEDSWQYNRRAIIAYEAS